MKNFSLVMFVLLGFSGFLLGQEKPAWDGVRFSTVSIRQSWNQEPGGYDRRALVSQPQRQKNKLPVIICFHGAGGRAGGMMRQYRPFKDSHLIVAAEGYRKTWNVHGEPSQAPDVKFFRELCRRLEKDYPADMEQVTLIGSSNGAGFIHRLLIEIDEPFSKRNILLAASMIQLQYHDQGFWKPSRSTREYDRRARPKSGREIHYFHGTRDNVVPYSGGLRFRRFEHLSAVDTAFAWARANGYRGPRLTEQKGNKRSAGVTEIRYPGTDVHFYSVKDGNHGFDPHRGEVNQIVQALIRKK